MPNPPMLVHIYSLVLSLHKLRKEILVPEDIRMHECNDKLIDREYLFGVVSQ
jgi:hypothetical protein